MDDEVQNRTTPMDLAKLTSIYIKIRDRRAEIKRMFEAEDNDLKEQMDVLVQWYDKSEYQYKT